MEPAGTNLGLVLRQRQQVRQVGVIKAGLAGHDRVPGRLTLGVKVVVTLLGHPPRKFTRSQAEGPSEP